MRSLQTYLNDLKNYTTFQGFKVGLSPSKKNSIMYFNGKPFKNDESWLFGHVGKTAWLERCDEFQSSWRHSLVNK